MKLLAEISEGSLGIGEYEKLGEKYDVRKSARAILLNEQGKMAVQHLTTYAFHKLPGGGVDPGETAEGAVVREVLEEVGCSCAISAPLGMVIEYRNKYNLLQISYCFVATVSSAIGTPQLEAAEIEEGHETLWLPPTDVLARMKQDTPMKFEGHFILKRETTFLEEYLSTQR